MLNHQRPLAHVQNSDFKCKQQTVIPEDQKILLHNTVYIYVAESRGGKGSSGKLPWQLESVKAADVFPGNRHRWNTNEVL